MLDERHTYRRTAPESSCDRGRKSNHVTKTPPSWARAISTTYDRWYLLSSDSLERTGRVAVPRTGGLGTGTIRNLVEGGIK